jgi:hypothetical protein
MLAYSKSICWPSTLRARQAAQSRRGALANFLLDGPSPMELMSHYFGIPTTFSRGGCAGNKLLNKLSNKLW